MKVETGQYYTVERRKEVADSARKLRRKFLRYKEAEIVYSIQHKKLLEGYSLCQAQLHYIQYGFGILWT